MKRRFFVQSLGAVALVPPLPLKALASKVATTSAPLNASYTPFMQANALAILRNNQVLSYADFIRKTGLNSTQADAMLARFAKLGWVNSGSLAGIHAIKPQWMKDFVHAQKSATGLTRSLNQLNAKLEMPSDDTPKFSKITRCCEPDASIANAAKGDDGEYDGIGDRKL